jgi:hypothetical protein
VQKIVFFRGKNVKFGRNGSLTVIQLKIRNLDKNVKNGIISYLKRQIHLIHLFDGYLIENMKCEFKCDKFCFFDLESSNAVDFAVSL